MKKIFVATAAVIFSLVGFTSCSDFLEENPKSSLTDVAYYKNETQLTENVTYLYRTGAPTRFATTGAYDPSFEAKNCFLTGYFTNSYEGQELDCRYARLLTRQSNVSTVSSTIDGVWDCLLQGN